MMDEVLGVDSGGTKTIAARANQQGDITFWCVGKGLDPTGPDDANNAMRDLLSQCGTPSSSTLGLPYHGEIANVSAQQTATAHAVLGSGALVLNDVAVAHIGAFSGEAGVLLLAGTGSMAWSVGPEGTRRTGGYGPIFGDEGSAYWIGCQALAVASCEIDERAQPTGFANKLCDAIGTTPENLIGWTYSHTDTRPAIASVALAMSNMATDGNEVAISIMKRAGQALSELGLAAARLAGLDNAAPWSIGGSVFSDATVLATATHYMGSKPLAPMLPPIGGALLDAAQRVGWNISDQWISTLAASLRQRV